ncbi:MAG: NAD(P)H-dependent oxidoreductase [Bacteroidales bacterium]|nr:NAD(P)H-dependent oxidoreductase [Bacteroidales bacterium]
MNILIINGSPKGKNSITLHTALYLEKKFPAHSFSYLDAGIKIRAFEKDFSPALEALKEAELIVFCYPVYTFLVPYQLHRFIELMKAAAPDLAGKAATQITTSKHFYDITAHRFIEDNCADLGLPFLDGLSADMEDLLTEKGRRQAVDWFEFTLWKLSRGEWKRPAVTLGCDRASQPVTVPISVPHDVAKKAVIVTDLEPGDEGLKAMIERFVAVFPYGCDVVNIREFPFQGGCISCFSCAATGKCAYKDGFDDFLRNTIHKHDAILYAFRIKDHSMGSRFKMYDDRQFCNGHRTVTMGTPFGYLVAGNYSAEENLRLLLEARAQVGGNFLAGVATDEFDTARDIDALAATVAYAMEKRYTPPQNFLGVGGMKIFRDLIYMMRGLMRADHKFFKSHGQYDFPQKQWRKSWAMYLVGAMMNSPRLKRKMGSRMSDGMLAPYKKVLDSV